MSTIRDVADRAGVSVATVSKYINGGAVRSKNREAIAEAISALNYKVNYLARSLKTSRTMAVGVILPSISAPFFARILRGIDRVLIENGYESVLCCYDSDPESERRKLEYFVSRGVDGLIYIPEHLTAGDINAIYKERSLPTVMVDRVVPGFECDYVIVDNPNAVYNCIEYLINRGHRRIAMVSGPEGVFTADDRLTGYERAMGDYGIPIDPELIVRGPFAFETGYKAFNSLTLLPSPPTAIFAASNDLTMGVITAAHEQNVVLSKDIDFFGFDCTEICRLLTPAINTVSQPELKMGETAANYLLSRINGDSSPIHLTRLKSKLIIQ